MRPLDNILSKLQNVTGRGDNNYSARCPAHDDQKNSLSIKVTEDGKVLIHCFAGCSTEAVIEVLGLDLQDLFDSTAPAPTASTQRSTVTVEALARHKKLSVEFLLSLGVCGQCSRHAVEWQRYDLESFLRDICV